MGKGIELARAVNPEHAALMDDLKDQLLIVFVNKLGGDVRIPCAEIDGTGQFVLSMAVDPDSREFRFIVEKKQ